MSGRTVIPLTESKEVRQRLIEAVGKVLARKGFGELSAEAIAREAGVSPALVGRLFGNLPGLVAEYGRSEEFWPTTEELLGDAAAGAGMSGAGEAAAIFFKNYLRAILSRPITIEIMSREMREQSPLSRHLDYARERTALEFFETVEFEPPRDVDFTAFVAVLAAALNYMILRARISNAYGGLDMYDEADVARMERMIETMCEKTLNPDS